MLARLTDTLNFQAEALGLRAERQRVLASNIANADTPGFQARDFDFAAALRAATAPAAGAAGPARPAGLAPAGLAATTHPGHRASLQAPAGRTTLDYASAAQSSVDRNSVDLDRERASFADNAVHYEATLRFLNGSVKTLTSAITGQ